MFLGLAFFSEKFNAVIIDKDVETKVILAGYTDS